MTLPAHNQLEGTVVRKAIAGILLLSMLLVSCREPVILRFPSGWRFEPDEMPNRTALTQQFTQQTGIQIREAAA